MIKETEEAIQFVEETFKVKVNERLLFEYLWGCHPELLNNEAYKVEKDDLKAIDRYLIGAASYLKWSNSYYNVFDPGRMCRMVILLQQLNTAVLELKNNNVFNLDKQINKLKKQKTFHDFEATLFELLVASKYVRISSRIEFIKESSVKEPDLFIRTKTGDEFFIECKKQIRFNNLAVDIRNEVRSKCSKVLGVVSHFGDSILVDLEFTVHPEVVTEEMILASLGHCRNNKLDSFQTPYFNLKITKLAPLPEDSGPYIYTSPNFLYSRYKYRESDQWMGFVNSGLIKESFHKDTPDHLQPKFTSWAWEIEKDSGIRWKIHDEKVLYKLKRLSVSKTFDAFDQLRSKGKNSIVHYWIESETGYGAKEKEFKEYLEKIMDSNDHYSHVIVNETMFDVTPNNLMFDLIEHAHYIIGPHYKKLNKPSVSSIFSNKEFVESSEYGIGAKLSDIDPWDD